MKALLAIALIAAGMTKVSTASSDMLLYLASIFVAETVLRAREELFAVASWPLEFAGVLVRLDHVARSS